LASLYHWVRARDGEDNVWAKTKMKAIITTSHSVLILDLETRELTSVHRGMGLYYGVTNHKGAIVVASRRRQVEQGRGPQDDRGCLIALEGKTPQVIEPNCEMRDLHDILSVGEDLWCICSFNNAICAVNDHGFQFHYPLGRPTEPPYDRNHLNTLVRRDDSVFVVAHNWGASEVFMLNPAAMTIVASWQIGIEAHNVWFDGDELRVFSSAEGCIVGLDGFKLQVGDFPRGYASDGNIRLIGINPSVSRDQRGRASPRLKILDHGYAEIGHIELPQEGMVLDIMALTDDEYRSLHTDRNGYAKKSQARQEPSDGRTEGLLIRLDQLF
jgi:hypothetical protein